MTTVRRAAAKQVPRNGDRPHPLRDKVKDKKAITTIATNARVIPVDQIGADPDQPRREFDGAELQALGDNMLDHGQLVPIRVRRAEGGDGWTILCGERRWRAALMVGMPTLTAMVEEALLPADERLVVQLIENCCRVDLAPLDQARAMRSLMEMRGWNQTRLAREVGVSQSAVSRSLALLELPAVLRDLVVAGELAAPVARELAKITDAGVLEITIKTAILDRWTREIAYNAVYARGYGRPEEASPNSLGYAACITEGIQGPSEMIVSNPPADYLVKCNGCTFTKKRSAPGGCPEGQLAGFSYAGKLGLEEEDEWPSKFLVKSSKGLAIYCLTAFSLEQADAWARSNHPADWGGTVEPISEEDWSKLPKWIGTRPASGGPSMIHVQEGGKTWQDLPISDPAFSNELEDRLSDSEIETAGEAWDMLESGSLISVHEWTPAEAKELEGVLVLLRMKAGDPAPCTEPDPSPFQVAKHVTIVKPAPGEGRDVPASAPKVSAPAPPPKKEQAVFGFASEQGFEIVITRDRPWTGQEILAAVWELKVKLERQYLKP